MIDLVFRYSSVTVIKNSKKAKEKLRHDIIDGHYLVTGLLEGSFATKEEKLIRWWKIFQPEVGLIKE